MRRLVEFGGGRLDVSVADRWGRTALHIASMWGCTDTALFLLQSGAAIDTIDNCGHAALHPSSFCSHAATALALLQAGAAVDAADNDDVTPIQMTHERTLPILEAWSRGEHPVQRARVAQEAAMLASREVPTEFSVCLVKHLSNGYGRHLFLP